MMNNIIVLPLIVPIMTAIFLVFLRDYIKLQRIISFITMIFVASITVLYTVCKYKQKAL